MSTDTEHHSPTAAGPGRRSRTTGPAPCAEMAAEAEAVLDELRSHSAGEHPGTTEVLRCAHRAGLALGRVQGLLADLGDDPGDPGDLLLVLRARRSLREAGELVDLELRRRAAVATGG